MCRKAQSAPLMDAAAIPSGPHPLPPTDGAEPHLRAHAAAHAALHLAQPDLHVARRLHGLVKRHLDGRGSRSGQQEPASRCRIKGLRVACHARPGAGPRGARTFSPSALLMAVISSAGGAPKSSDAMASKHLRRWGCTASGLRAWLRIWGRRGVGQRTRGSERGSGAPRKGGATGAQRGSHHAVPQLDPPAAARRSKGRRSARTQGAWSRGSPTAPFAPPPAACCSR
jgi:hypothetical protein